MTMTRVSRLLLTFQIMGTAMVPHRLISLWSNTDNTNNPTGKLVVTAAATFVNRRVSSSSSTSSSFASLPISKTYVAGRDIYNALSYSNGPGRFLAPSSTATGMQRTNLSLYSTRSNRDENSKDDNDAPDADDTQINWEGANLAAQFSKLTQQKGIRLNENDLKDDDDEEDEDDNDEEDEDDEPEPNFPQGAINAFLGYDTGNVGEKLAGNVTLTNQQLYSEVKERVLDTAGGFVELVGGAREDEDDEEDDDASEEWKQSGEPKPYIPPEAVPDSDLTAGEVVILVLDAFRNNDVPTKNKGVEIFFGYSSPGSQIKQEVDLTPEEYAEYLKETEYKILFENQGASIDKADYSFDGKKAFFTARLQAGSNPLDSVSVNFILSTTGVDDDSCWLIDSMLIRPQSMRRRRRR